MNRPKAPDKLKPEGIDLDRRNLLTLTGASLATFGMMSILPISFAKAQDMTSGANNFYTSNTVTLQKVTFKKITFCKQINCQSFKSQRNFC